MLYTIKMSRVASLPNSDSNGPGASELTGGQGVIFAILAPISVSLCKLSGTEEYLIEAK